MFERMKNWFSQPFTTGMDAVGWFLFIGLLIVIMVLWGIILRELRDLGE